MAQAIELAVDDANALAEKGAPAIRLSILDDEGRESTGRQVAQTFASDPEIVAVIGHYNSNVTLAVAPIYDNAGLPLVGPIVSNPLLTGSGWRNVFRFTNRDDVTAAAIADHLIGAGQKRRAVVVATDTIYGKSMGREFARAFERFGGRMLANHTIQEGETEFGALIREFPAAMDVLFYGGTFEGAPLLRTLRGAGISTLFAAGDGCWDVGNFLEPAGPCAEQGEGVLVLSACPQVGTVDGSADFASRFEARYGPIKNYAVNSYDAAALTIECLRTAAQSVSRQIDRQQALQAIRQCKRQGIAYPEAVSWDDKGDNVAAMTALHVVKNGRYHQIALVQQDGGPTSARQAQ
jgi:branched-chain amino acid transport system substrate-binding protein